MSRYTIIGHRGSGVSSLQSGFPENSLISFQNAFSLGAAEVEFDLALSADGVIFIYHDPLLKVERKLGWKAGGLKKIFVSKMSWPEIKSYHNHVITFSELIEKMPDKTFVIELKAYTDYKYIFETVYKQFINDSNYLNFRFISFSFEALKHIKQINPELYCIYIATCIDQRFQPFVSQTHLKLCIENNINEISGHWIGFRPKIIRQVKESGIEVGLGLINSKIDFNYCQKNSVKRLYTDNIKLITKLIENQ